MTLLDIPQTTIPDLMGHHGYHAPGRLAVVVGDTRLTWGEFNNAINRAANRFLELGIRKGERVAFLMATSAECLCLMFGAVRAGASMVPISTLLSSDQIAGLVNDAEAVLLFTDASCQALVDPIVGKLATVRADGLFSDVSTDPWRDHRAWLEGAPESHPRVDLTLDDEIAISYSSGTTGIPKGVVYTHRARQMMGVSYAIEMHFDRHAIALATTPFYSNGTSVMLFPTLVAGGTIVLMPRFDTKALLEVVERERVTHTLMVPTQFIRLLDEPGLGTADLSSVKVFLTLGSPMRPDTKAEVIARLGPRLYEVYGFSEGGVTIIGPQEMATRPSSVGIATVGFEARILAVDADIELARGEVGEIAFYGGWAMRCYQNNPELTAALVWRDELGRSFLRTGDIGKMDSEGYIYVVDRKKDMIISGGFNVFPADIEAVIGQHPAVEDVTVIGVPHREWGETPLALIIPRRGTLITATELAAWANERLGKMQRIAAVEFVSEFPRNALGKVLKGELREPRKHIYLNAIQAKEP